VKYHWIDLTHKIDENISVFPGTMPPCFKEGSTIAVDGFKETVLHLYSHTGTHIDSPAHIFDNGKCLDEMPLDFFIGKACCLNVAGLAKDTPITVDMLSSYSELLEKTDFLLLYTGWSRYWGRSEYLAFPYLAESTAAYLTRFSLKGIGIDAISIEPVNSEALPVHRTLLAQRVLSIENLTNLDTLPTEMLFDFFAVPLKFIHSDGAPVRAFARIPITGEY